MSSATSSDIQGWVGDPWAGFVEGIARAEHGRTTAVNIPAGDPTQEPNGTTSLGLCQINAGEAQSVGYSEADMLDPQKNALAFAALCAIRGPKLVAVGVQEGSRDYYVWLAFYHNGGGGPALAFAQGQSWTDKRGGVSTAQTFNQGKTWTYANFAADYAGASSAPTSGSDQGGSTGNDQDPGAGSGDGSALDGASSGTTGLLIVGLLIAGEMLK
jgi:hypothetical protein